jgi:hypothetical protein
MQDTIETAEADCRAAWNQFFLDNGLDAKAMKFIDGSPIQGWCIHHEEEYENLTEPIGNRIDYILSSKPKPDQACRLMNLRPMSLQSIRVTGTALAEYRKVTGTAHLLDVPNHTWNGKSIFK